MTNKTTNAINTRFDEYSNPGFNGPWSHWPPAPNIYEYQDVTPRVAITGLDATRFSRPDWKYDDWRAAQVARYGALPGSEPQKVGGVTPLRWNVYQWEIAKNRILAKPIPAHTPAGAERRLLTVAVLSCNALGIQGRMSFPVFSPDGYAKFFLYKKATGPSGATISGEYIGWSEPGGDSNTHVDVQLYQ